MTLFIICLDSSFSGDNVNIVGDAGDGSGSSFICLTDSELIDWEHSETRVDVEMVDDGNGYSKPTDSEHFVFFEGRSSESSTMFVSTFCSISCNHNNTYVRHYICASI